MEIVYACTSSQDKNRMTRRFAAKTVPLSPANEGVLVRRRKTFLPDTSQFIGDSPPNRSRYVRLLSLSLLTFQAPPLAGVPGALLSLRKLRKQSKVYTLIRDLRP